MSPARLLATAAGRAASIAESAIRVTGARVRGRGRVLRWGLATAAALVALVAVASVLVEEPLRRQLEARMNERLEGYTVSVGRLDFHPLGFSLDLHDVVVVQDDRPRPPVADIRELSASVQWRQLLRARLVANFTVREPALYIDRAHLGREAEDATPVQERGWQDALQSIYPLKINEFEITDGRLTYVDAGNTPPLHVSHVELVARNIRNIRSPERTYPSTLKASAVVFGTGRASVDGHADFLAVPHPGVRVNVKLDDVPLAQFAPVLRRYNTSFTAGRLAATGLIEYAPGVRIVDIGEATLSGVRADYVNREATAAPARRAAREGARVAREVQGDPDTLVRLQRLVVTGSELGWVNREERPSYRVFLADVDLRVDNLTNHGSEGRAEARLRGRFMGSGATSARARFRPGSPPDLELVLGVEDTDVRDMNDVLRAHAKVDVTRGSFSLFSEVRVAEGRISGYVKPFFHDLDVYDPAQDREKSVWQKLYERLVGGLSALLENRPRDEVATRADLSGRVDDPKTSTLQIVLRLIQNAFFKAILPGFERQGRR